MIPGPVYHYKCPQCGCIHKRHSLTSGNTFGARFYSDGMVDAPMWPRISDIGKCTKCDTIFWPHKEKTVARYRWDDVNRPEADTARMLGMKDHYRALETGLASTNDEEFYIRQQLWWWQNDMLRDDPDDPESIMNTRYEENCRAMIGLLNYDNLNERITIAELHRNLGNFDECRRIISRIRKPEWTKVKKALLEECKKGNRVVFQYEKKYPETGETYNG